MTEDEEDVRRRIKSVIPRSWFASNADAENNPVLNAVLAGPSLVGGWAYGLLKFTKAQGRLATATDGFLDLYAFDFFGDRLRRSANQKDDVFRARIRSEILRPRVTRPAMEQLLVDLTGRQPTIFEPWHPNDAGRYGDSVRSPSIGLTGLSVDSAYFELDTTKGASRGINTVVLGPRYLDNGVKVQVYTATSTVQSYVQQNYRFRAGRRYRVRCKVQRLSGLGQTGDIMSISYHNGASSARAAFAASKVIGNDPFEASVEFTNQVDNTYANYFLGGVVDGQWAIWDVSVTEVVDPTGYPKITVQGRAGAYGTSRYGSLIVKKTVFIDVYRNFNAGIPRVSGYGVSAGGYGVGRARWSSLDDMRSNFSDDEILSAIRANKPKGVTVWVKIHG